MIKQVFKKGDEPLLSFFSQLNHVLINLAQSRLVGAGELVLTYFLKESGTFLSSSNNDNSKSMDENLLVWDLLLKKSISQFRHDDTPFPQSVSWRGDEDVKHLYYEVTFIGHLKFMFSRKLMLFHFLV